MFPASALRQCTLHIHNATSEMVRGEKQEKVWEEAVEVELEKRSTHSATLLSLRACKKVHT